MMIRVDASVNVAMGPGVFVGPKRCLFGGMPLAAGARPAADEGVYFMPVSLKCQLVISKTCGLNTPLLVDTHVAAYRHSKPWPSVGCIENGWKCLKHCGVNASTGLRETRKINRGKWPKRWGRGNGATRQGSRYSSRNGICCGGWCRNGARWRISGCGCRQCCGRCRQSWLSRHSRKIP